MYLLIWRFRVRPERRDEFLRRYAADGDWATLFGRSEEYVGTELLQADGELDAFLTIDRWHSREGWDRFRATCRAEYEALDKACEGLTLEEEKVGVGVTL